MTRFIAIGRHSYDTWRMRLVPTILTVLALVITAGPASARVLDGGQHQMQAQSDEIVELQIVFSDGLTLSQATAKIRKQTGGKIVSAETKVQGGREVHHIKVLTKDGKVKTHKVNGKRR